MKHHHHHRHHHHHHRHRQKRSLRERVARFWHGRNGMDELGGFLIILLLLLLIPCFLVHFWLEYVIWFALLVIACYTLFRILSRNLKSRKKENARYRNWLSHFKRFFLFQRQKWKERKTHVFVRCKCCKRILRLPREKGKHTVKCPMCCERFELKIR